MTKKNKIKYSLRLWHKRLGTIAAIIIIMLSGTGILINNSEQLELNKQALSSDWLLKQYGITKPAQFTGYNVGPQWLTLSANTLYQNGKVLGTCKNNKLKLTRDKQNIYVLCSAATWVFSSSLELLEYSSDQQLAAHAFTFEAQALPKELNMQLRQAWQIEELHLERLLLDIHSGAFWGIEGKRFIDISAIALIYLALSGLYLNLRP